MENILIANRMIYVNLNEYNHDDNKINTRIFNAKKMCFFFFDPHSYVHTLLNHINLFNDNKMMP